MGYFIQRTDGVRVGYRSLVVKPGDVEPLTNELAVKILHALKEKSSCAIDVARKLGVHEQKVYYHIRRLEKSGFIKLERTEERAGGTAKIYSVAYPVVTVKLHDEGKILKEKGNTLKLLKPFIVDGRLNAKIIVGDPRPHGKYGAIPRDASYALDLAMFFGTFIREFEYPCYKLDTDVKEKDLKENLILVGGPKANMVVAKLNKKKLMPVCFEKDSLWGIRSLKTKKLYDYDYEGVIVKMKNPFNTKRSLLLLAGKRSHGTRAALLGFIKHFDEIKELSKNEEVVRFVRGHDEDGDSIVDTMKFLE